MEQITQQWVKERLPFRKPDGHKGDFGRVLAVCGAVGYTGAPVFAAKGAVRSGAGLVFLAVPESIYPVVAVKCDEAMPFPLPAQDGVLSSQALLPLLQRISDYDALLLGCGLGRGPGVDEVVCGLLGSVQCPVVLDADGINCVARHIHVLDSRQGQVTVLTPHEGEFLRLGGDLSLGRETAARSFAEKHGCYLILKGHRTVVASPQGELLRNTTGNCGMAKGGSGDVLAGMLLSFLGQGLEPLQAAGIAVFLHGRSGDLCAKELSEYAMTPSDVVEHLPQAFISLL